jgi:putative MATE family efflux protein
MFMVNEQAAPAKENKLGVMPINKLLISMSLPMMVSMLVQALYNIVDSIFVSRIGEAALTAVSLSFPIQNLMIAVSGGTGVGINALLSKSLGEKNFKESNRAANVGIFLMLLSSAVFAVLGLTLSRFFFEQQTTDPVILEYGIQYLTVVTVGSVFLFGQMTMERLLMATGNPMYSMISQISGAVTNIILDPIMIFGLLGFPAMGVTGAAVATIIGQTVGMGISLYFNLAKNKEIRFRWREIRPRAATIQKIYAVGVPSIIMQSIGSVMTFCMNQILMSYSSTATAVFGVYFKLQSFVFMPVFGLNNGLVPIVAYNFGARRKDRMILAIKMAILYAMAIMVLGFLVFQIFPAPLLTIFNATEEMQRIGVHALRKISISFLFAGYCIISGTVFQALGKSMYSLAVSIARQLVVLLPLCYLLSYIGGLDAVWFAFPLAEIMSVTITTVFLRRIYRTIIKPLGDAPAVEPMAAKR